MKNDPCIEAMINETEEAKNVTRQGGDNKQGEKYYQAYERIMDSEMEPVHAGNFFSLVSTEEEKAADEKAQHND